MAMLFDTSNIGRCSYCMRKAFLAMMASWAILVALIEFSLPGMLLVPVGVISIALTALWLLHVITYASRASAKPLDAAEVTARREVFNLFAKALAGAALATALPRLALAGSCSTTCGSTRYSTSCPDGHQCNCNCNQGCYCS
jgi:hypothetical protein